MHGPGGRVQRLSVQLTMLHRHTRRQGVRCARHSRPELDTLPTTEGDDPRRIFTKRPSAGCTRTDASSPVPPVAAVLFDLDDTLLDRRRTLDHYLADHALRAGLPAHIAATYRTRFYELDGCGYAPRASVFGQLCVEFPSLPPADTLIADYREHAFRRCEFTEGATDVLAWCSRAGLARAIVTNGSSAMQRAKLEALALADLVDLAVVSGEEGIHKPETELFHRVAARLGAKPEECAFVGDNPQNDVDGARRAGMTAVWFQRELPWPSELPAPSLVITNLAALPRALGRP